MLKESHPGIRSWLMRAWHLPDRLSWMNPLPPAHRRGIILALLVMLLAFLCPTPSPRDNTQRPATEIGSRSKEVPLQAEIYDSSTVRQQASSQQNSNRWQSYQIASGQTLAQLFRDNNLPVNDVFAMARVEGDDKPLSNLHSGQQVKIRKDAKEIVTGLTVEGKNGPVLFTRQPDGTFLRSQ